ncbi:tyrosine-type recombinase/integrase [Cognatishimia maritima]|uniref:Site-specific recombinase XerC n=1 Tax=Cognatishimia maritima TaxID=870908 RepID=A0A1M5V9S7_9RHOB|nr:tyrosine-type recombinase/integrase [Cognatishimia maritima]SHH71663.1 Site-specific recombinase XerC [Cognatishimia maritima]
MTTKLTQVVVGKLAEQHDAGTQIYDKDAKGLRLVVGKRSISYKHVGRINDGTNRYVTVMIGRTDEVSLKSARERSAELRLALRRGEDPRVKKVSVPTLEQAMERYLNGRKDLTPNTVDSYRRKMNGPLRSLLKLPADRIDREVVRSLHERLTKKSGPYAANGAMRVLKLLLNDVARTHDLGPNPVSRGVRMNKEKARDWAVGPKEMAELWRRLDEMDHPLRRACWLLMLTTGLRSTNARSVKWEHLEDDGVLFVPRAKSGRSFHLPLPRLVLQELSRVKDLTRPLESPFMFPSSTSKSGHIEQMSRIRSWPYAPHQMRHTYRTHAMEAGVDFQSVTMLMDHANTHVSFNYVTRAHLTGHLRECQERICDRLLSYRGT